MVTKVKKIMNCTPQWLWRTSLIFCLSMLSVLMMNEQTAVAQTTQSGTVTGTVHNGTTDEPAAEGTEVTLHAYNSSYTNAETLTTTLDADGRFQFNLTDQPDDWVYLVSIAYQDLSFSSNIAPLAANQPLDLSLTVYEPTSDPAQVIIEQLHVSLSFVGQEVEVSELYSVANEGTAVFTGSMGSSEAGTVQVNLPAAAQAVSFERGMGPNSGFFPTSEVIKRDGRWYDTTPLRPGPNSLTLRATYRLPLEDGLDLSRELPYQTNSVTVALPDNRIAFAADGWQQQSTQSIGERGVILSYGRDGLAPNSQLALAFSGTTTSAPSVPLNSANSGDWIISLGILLLVTIVAFRLLRPKTKFVPTPQLAAAGPAPLPNEGDKVERWQLLFALADLDEAYKSGKLPDAEYERQRQEIKNQLRTIWEVV